MIYSQCSKCDCIWLNASIKTCVYCGGKVRRHILPTGIVLVLRQYAPGPIALHHNTVSGKTADEVVSDLQHSVWLNATDICPVDRSELFDVLRRPLGSQRIAWRLIVVEGKEE